jgi:hypothetical protein
MYASRSRINTFNIPATMAVNVPAMQMREVKYIENFIFGCDIRILVKIDQC